MPTSTERVYLDPERDTTDAPYRRTVGHELEYASGNLVRWLGERGLSHDRLHGYGCDCSEADRYLIHATSDCTAGGGEFIIGGSRGVLFGSPVYYQATLAMAEGCLATMPGVTTRVGGHTHVGSGDLTEVDQRRLVRNYLAIEDELVKLMAASLDEVRSNGNVSPRLNQHYIVRDPSFWTMPVEELTFPLPDRPTLNFSTGQRTIEFRAWNSTRAQWRMVLAGAVSSALVEAAKQARGAERGESVTSHLDGLLRPEIEALIYRQLKSKGVK